MEEKSSISRKKRREEELRGFNRWMPLLISAGYGFVIVFAVFLLISLPLLHISLFTGGMATYLVYLKGSMFYYPFEWIVITIAMYGAMRSSNAKQKKNKKNKKR